MTEWYQKQSGAVLAILETDAEKGLSQGQALHRQKQYGPNELVERGLTSPWRILCEQLTAVMVAILLVAAVVSGFLGNYKDAIVILANVVLNALLGFTQEFRAEKAVAASKQLAVPTVRVRRGRFSVKGLRRESVIYPMKNAPECSKMKWKPRADPVHPVTVSRTRRKHV